MGDELWRWNFINPISISHNDMQYDLNHHSSTKDTKEGWVILCKKNHNISKTHNDGALSISPYLPNNGVLESSKFISCDLHGTFSYLFQIVAALNFAKRGGRVSTR